MQRFKARLFQILVSQKVFLAVLFMAYIWAAIPPEDRSGPLNLLIPGILAVKAMDYARSGWGSGNGPEE